MTAITAVDAWPEIVYVGIIAEGGSEVQFACSIKEIDFGEEGKPIEVEMTACGSNVIRKQKQGSREVTLTLFPLDVDSSSGNNLDQHFNPPSASVVGDDTSDVVAVTSSNIMRKHKLIFLHATEYPATAGAATSTGVSARRKQIINAYLTSLKDNIFTDGTQEVKFTYAPFSKSATANVKIESTAGGTALSAVTASATEF